jgi:hypothetical protein
MSRPATLASRLKEAWDELRVKTRAEVVRVGGTVDAASMKNPAMAWIAAHGPFLSAVPQLSFTHDPP